MLLDCVRQDLARCWKLVKEENPQSSTHTGDDHSVEDISHNQELRGILADLLALNNPKAATREQTAQEDQSKNSRNQRGEQANNNPKAAPHDDVSFIDETEQSKNQPNDLSRSPISGNEAKRSHHSPQGTAAHSAQVENRTSGEQAEQNNRALGGNQPHDVPSAHPAQGCDTTVHVRKSSDDSQQDTDRLEDLGRCWRCGDFKLMYFGCLNSTCLP